MHAVVFWQRRLFVLPYICVVAIPDWYAALCFVLEDDGTVSYGFESQSGLTNLLYIYVCRNGTTCIIKVATFMIQDRDCDREPVQGFQMK